MPEKHYWVTYADCGQLFNHIDADDPVEACRLLDRWIGLEVEEYCAFPMQQRPDRSAYWVHQAPGADWCPAKDKDTDDEVAAARRQGGPPRRRHQPAIAGDREGRRHPEV